jgi:6-phosphogluconolactonase
MLRPKLMASALCLTLGLAATAMADHETCWVYFGTSKTDASRGIYRSLLNQRTGALSEPVRVADKSDSAFFVFSPDKKHLYGLAEVGGGPRPREAIETYEVNAATGALTQVAERVADGTEACHINIDPTGKCLLTANYDDRYVEVFPILPDATVGERSCLVRHSGSGPNLPRQNSAHPHSVNFDPSGKYAIVADLGLDRLFTYKLDADKGILTPGSPPFLHLTPGNGPRHFAFHPDGVHAFVINELHASITVLTWNADQGAFEARQTLPIIAPDYTGPTNTAAEVVVSRDGNFVYGSNRGDDSIVVTRFDANSGRLSFVQRMGEGVKVPRNYAIDPSGKWLVCGNLKSDTATIYRIDPASGRLSLAGSVSVPEPLCVRYLEVE